MKNKQHEYILKAFLESSIPSVIRRNCKELIAIDSILAGYCTQLIKRAKSIQLPTDEIISQNDKISFSNLIDQSSGMERDELILYYRLVILVEFILVQYRQI